MHKAVVLDRTTSENISYDYADFVSCLNCGRTMLVNIGEDKCPECGEDSLVWAEYVESISKERLKELGYILCDVE